MAFDIKLARRQRLSETYQILRSHANNASTWAVNFRYEKERDRHHKWQDQHLDAFGFSLSCTIANQQVGADGDRCHHTPSRKGNPVPPCSLRVSLGVQHFVHARNGQGEHWCRLRRSWGTDGGPELALQLSSIGIDLRKLLLIGGLGQLSRH